MQKLSYTNGVLTVIAIALCIIAVQNFSSPAEAQSSSCGVYQPCIVTLSDGHYADFQGPRRDQRILVVKTTN